MGDLGDVLPSTARIIDGRLQLGGCDTGQLCQQYGTPVIVYDAADIRHRCRELRQAFPSGVSYASKAFASIAILQLVTHEGLGVDVASHGEWRTALEAGVAGADITYHGNNKSLEELTQAVQGGVGRVVIDSLEEIDRLGHALRHAHRGQQQQVLIRMTPAVSALTHRHISTGDDDSKFGLLAETGELAIGVESVRRYGSMHLLGIHVHVGSQLADLTATVEATRRAAAVARDEGLRELCVGGGLGVAENRQHTVPTIGEWSRVTHAAARETGFAGVITAEPGRSVVGRAGVTFYEVGTIKQRPGRSRIVAVNGGLSDNVRPAMYGATYEAFAATRMDAGVTQEARVVGKNCESGDTLVHHAQLPESLESGDLVCVPAIGAYTYALSSNYNKLPRPAVVLVEGGQSRLIMRRDDSADLLRSDVRLDPDFLASRGPGVQFDHPPPANREVPSE